MASHSTTWRTDIPKNTNPLRFFVFSSAPHWYPALIASLAVVVAATTLTLVSYIFKDIANAIAALPQTHSYAPLLLSCGAYVAALFFGHAAFRLSGFWGARWATGARATARYALSAYVTLHSTAYFSNRFAGSLSTKISHAGNGIRMMVEHILWQFLELGVSVVGSFVIAFFAAPLLGWIFLLWVAVALAINIYFSKRRVPLSARAQELESRLNGATVDLLSNITAMQQYARRLFEIERIQSLTESRREAGLRTWHYGERMMLLNGVLQAVFGGGMAFTAVYLAAAGQITGGDVILILTVIFRIEGLLLTLGQHLNGFAETWGEIEESLEEILAPHEMPEQEGAAALHVQGGGIVLDAVDFSFGGFKLFDKLSLVVQPGQRVGLVGKSGAGKSTLVRLILRHYEVEGGSIAIDGTNIAQVTQESLRNAISVVPQEPLLFHRTVRENIAYGDLKASGHDIERAAQLAHAHEFIGRLAQKYQTLVGERGIRLSGGERQRIAIARAILKNAPILLLDEATSALDSESEVRIQQALQELMRGKTVIAIAHRLSTLREMDRVIVLDKGRIIEDGRHDELIKKGGAYAELWRHQAGGFIE